MQNKLAIQTATAMLEHGEITKENSAPLYVFSVLTMLVSMAMPRKADKALLLGHGGVVEWTRLVQGIRTIVGMGRTWIRDGGLGMAVQDSTRPETLRSGLQDHASPELRTFAKNTDTTSLGDTTFEQPDLAGVREFIASRICGQGDSNHQAQGQGDAATLNIYLRAIDKLDHIFSIFCKYGETLQTVRLIFTFLSEMDADSLDNLGQQTPYAILIFSYFGVMLYWIDHAW